MITEGDSFPCDHCEHNGDCERGFDCSKLESYYITTKRIKNKVMTDKAQKGEQYDRQRENS